jgi:hypothetical protein
VVLQLDADSAWLIQRAANTHKSTTLTLDVCSKAAANAMRITG